MRNLTPKNSSTNWIDILGWNPFNFDNTISVPGQVCAACHPVQTTKPNPANEDFDQAIDDMFDSTKPKIQYRVFGLSHPWTEQMKTKPVYERMRNFIKNDLNERCKYSSSGIKISSGRWDDSADDLPWSQFLYDGMTYIFGRGLKSTGSVKGVFVAHGDCCTRKAKVGVILRDQLRAGSMTRIPGWVPFIGDHELLDDEHLNIINLECKRRKRCPA